MPWQREIWLVKQKESANNTDPKQPADNSKPLRPYLVMGYYSGKTNSTVTVLPIQTPKPNVVYKFELLSTKENGLANNSWVICSHIFTIDSRYLDRKLGVISQNDFDIIHSSMSIYLAKK